MRVGLNDSSNADFVNSVLIPGYKMYSFGGYPYVVKAGILDFIRVDLFNIKNLRIEESIDSMECGAGYHRHTITVDNVDYTMYIRPQISEYTPYVESGDWIAYQKSPEARASRW